MFLMPLLYPFFQPNCNFICHCGGKPPLKGNLAALQVVAAVQASAGGVVQAHDIPINSKKEKKIQGVELCSIYAYGIL
jgi:hypothetical protein